MQAAVNLSCRSCFLRYIVGHLLAAHYALGAFCCCSYYVSAKTGSSVKSCFWSIAADLAGIPIMQQQLDAANVSGDISTQQQQQQLLHLSCKVEVPASPAAASPLLATASGVRSRRAGSCVDGACSGPKLQEMSSNSTDEAGIVAGHATLPKCKCCHCSLM